MRLSLVGAALVAGGLVLTPLHAATRLMFVTSVAGSGDLSTWADAAGQTGLAAGDAICQARAAAAGLPNAQAFRAWLSDSNDDAYCRMHGLNGKMAANCGQGLLPAAGGPWWRTDGKPFGAGFPDLLEPLGKVLNPPDVDEFGTLVNQVATWTGTDVTGALGGGSCANWTSSSAGAAATNGGTLRTTQSWTSSGTSDCSPDWFRLFCFETGVGDPLPSFPLWGRLAFMTSAHGTGNLGSWPGADGAIGIDAGDSICQNLAAAAGIREPETFKAWLSDGATDAIDRFQYEGPWMRLDGVPVATSKADLTDQRLLSSIHLDEAGHYFSNWVVWTGTLWTGETGPTHCSSWTSGTTGTGVHGNANDTSGYWTGPNQVSCDFSWAYIYCLQDSSLVFLDGFETGDTLAWTLVVP